jgi:hypothetical protein
MGDSAGKEGKKGLPGIFLDENRALIVLAGSDVDHYEAALALHR